MNRGGGGSLSGRSPMPSGSPFMTRSTSRPLVEPSSCGSSPAVTATTTGCPGDDDVLHREIANLRKLHHPKCVKLLEVLEVLEVPDGGQIYMGALPFLAVIRMESVEEIDLNLERLVSETCHGGPILHQILLGLEYLHEHHTEHRDLKPDNLLLAAGGSVKIVDSSISECFASADDILSSAGSPAFFVPELFGVTLSCMVFGRLPFHGESVLDLYRAIATSEPDYTLAALRGASTMSLAPVGGTERCERTVDGQDCACRAAGVVAVIHVAVGGRRWSTARA
ncbi:serine/threonine protein kinase [Allomyces macrogynus ATCC 38327]|uniref:Serine/threonine protein kinase n=1 Tax=Allomyces macrogynus (strain ATCC 38327) TaxID=578462 RepID=A0A0L0T3H3_ALLM3|nr:serine/threonine protein kinase [Allomyces macrogynus ATCC 38327]|eukprot:KNE69388.1 serine/threonine protein kinase [Allomyces macrogynus ATCC 38327]